MAAITMPQASVSMEEARLVRWLVQEGEAVSAGQPVAEIETDKAVVEIEAPADGIFKPAIAPDTTIAVGGVIGQIIDSQGDVEPAQPTDTARPTAPAGRRPASPAARRLAGEHGISLETLVGSGPGGRIQVDDVERAVAGARARTGQSGTDSLRTMVVRGITESWRQIPHIHIWSEIDTSGLIEAKRVAAELRLSPRPTLTDLMILALRDGLGQVPALNGTVGADGQVKLGTALHLALAVTGPDGVVAPVIRHAGTLTLGQIAMERVRLVHAARTGRLEKKDLGGATFTLSNLGTLPVDLFAPVITAPQIAVLAAGRAKERPVVVDGRLVACPTIWINVSIDHRAADGEAGGRLLAALERAMRHLPSEIQAATAKEQTADD